MFKALSTRRRRLGVALAPLAATAVVLGLGAPAYAANNPTGPTGGNANSGNYNIFQGGSNTTYFMMQDLAKLFNESPGCDLAAAAGSAQPLDFGCPGVNDVGTGQSGANEPSGSSFPGPYVGENGLTPFAQENPFNDILIEEPATGSSNGIAELEDQGTHATGATSSVSISGVTLTATSTTLTTTSSFLGVAVGDKVSDSAGDIPSGDTVAVVNSTTQITLAAPASASTTESITVKEATNVAPLDVARSSRAPNLTSTTSPGDDKGLNFVAYAEDGVSWIHWTEFNGTPTPSAAVSNLSTTQLGDIFSDLGCTVGSTTYTTPNWACYGGTAGAIDVYWAQSGSGTESTWASMLGQSGPYSGIAADHVIFENETASITANDSKPNEGANNAIFFFSYGKFQTTCSPAKGYCGAAPSGFPTGTSTLALGNIGLPVNQDTISAQLPSYTGSTVTNVEVTSGKTKVKETAASVPTPAFADAYVGEPISGAGIPPGDTIATVASTGKKITLTTAATATNTSETVTLTAAEFPGDRLLYNVYSDGSNADIPRSSLAALNAVSEDGFLCKPSTVTDVDPNTGDTYRSEIDAAITSEGFFPLPLAIEDGNGSTIKPYTTTASGIPAPAWNAVNSIPGLGGSGYDAASESGAPYNFPTGDQDTDNTAENSTEWTTGGEVTTGGISGTPTNPVGYCLVLSTDGNSTN